MDPVHLREICQAFDIGQAKRVTKDTEGALNINYFLETENGRKYFIKSVRGKQKSQIPYVAAVEKFFSERSIPAVCMLASASGALSLEIGDDVYTVYPYVENDSSLTYAAGNIEAMGTTLGAIHRAGSEAVPEVFLSRSFKPPVGEEVIEKLTERRTLILEKETLDATDEQFLEYIDLKLSTIAEAGSFPSLPNDTLTHGDYHERNILFGASGIAGICDWEKAMMEPRAYELARAIEIICFGMSSSRMHSEEQMRSLAMRFLGSYAAVYPISMEELRAGLELRYSKILHSVWIEHQYYDLGDSRSNRFIQNEMRLIKARGIIDRVEW